MYNKVFSTRTRQVIYLVVLAMVVMCAATYIIFTNRSLIMGELDFSSINLKFTYAQLLIMFTAGLWGLTPATVVFIIAFVDLIMYDVNEAYSMSIYLIAMVGAYYLSNRKCYRHIFTTVIGGVILNACMGGVWSVVGTIASGEGLGGINLDSVFDDQIYVLVECIIYCTSMYLFMKFAPSRIKRAFPMGVDYIEGDELNGDIRDYRFVHNSRISRKLTRVVVIQALLLGIAAAVFAAQLMPSIADEVLSDSASDLESFFKFRPSEKPSERPDMMGERNTDDTQDGGSDEADTPAGETGDKTTTGADAGGEETAESGTGQRSDQFAQNMQERRNARIQTQRFIFNNAGASFVTKLILMILNISLPMVVLENSVVQWMVARPITAMAKTLREFSEAKDEKEQEERLRAIEDVHLKGRDEIVDLYESISDMARRITSFVDQKLREAELEEEVRVAQRASESKSNFLNNVSHELRTPINAVLGLDEMIVRETSEDNIRKYAYDIQSAGKSLLSLVNDILDSSKLEEGKMEILPVEYELGSVINDIVNMIAVKARDKNLEFNLDIDEHLPHILYGDEIRIKQVIVNILTNAVKYTEKGGFTLRLSFKKTSDEDILLYCAVSDTGIGIKEEDMAKLFSRFERIEENRNRTIEGTGLGMNIVQQLLGLMDSELSVESVYGEGSTFSFEVAQRVISWEEMGDFAESYRRSLETMGQYEKKFTAPDALILVTDDTPMNLTVIRGLLKPTKIGIETAESGYETIDKIREKKYDVIFLDHRMPGMDGIETLEEMKKTADSKNLDTPVIALTANAISGAREKYLSAGFVDYLSKPIDSTKLEKMLMYYLGDEKVITVDEEAVPAQEDVVAAQEEVVPEPVNETVVPTDPVLLQYSEVPGIEYGEALKNCSSEEVLLEALKDYTADIPKKAELIEGYVQKGDYENYTVLVHALKSSSRLVGAINLSKYAKHLEDCGNAAKAGDEKVIAEIKRRTPMMLALYRGYYDCFAPILGMPAMAKPSAKSSESEPDERECISKEKLGEALSCLRDLAETFDFDSMESVTGMLDEYRLPEDFLSHYERIKEEIHNVDQGALMEELNKVV